MVFAGFYLVGIPISLLLCFYFDMGMKGISIGFICGSATMGLLFYITIAGFCNWEEISRDVRKKMKDDGNNQKDTIKNKELKHGLLN